MGLDIWLKDPYTKKRAIMSIDIEDFNSMTPEEYEKYYNKHIKPLKETINNLIGIFQKLEENNLKEE